MITNIATGNGLLSRLDDTCRRAYYDLIGVAQISASAARRLMVEVSCIQICHLHHVYTIIGRRGASRAAA